MSEEKWHRLPADEVGFFIGKDANATRFPVRPESICKGTLLSCHVASAFGSSSRDTANSQKNFDRFAVPCRRRGGTPPRLKEKKDKGPKIKGNGASVS